MRRTSLCVLALALTVPACADSTGPENESALPQAAGPTPTAAALYVAQPINLPPLQPRPTFWTCAAEAEGRFATAATQILVLELQALLEPDPFRRSVLLAEVERRKMDAKRALWFALTVCVDTYGSPRLFALPDASGNLVFMPFSVAVYHQYLVEKYLEKPE